MGKDKHSGPCASFNERNEMRLYEYIVYLKL
jgi:hypothetical protein